MGNPPGGICQVFVLIQQDLIPLSLLNNCFHILDFFFQNSDLFFQAFKFCLQLRQ